MSERAGTSESADQRAGSIYRSHLQLKLQMVDVRLQRAVRLWQQAGQDPDDAFRGLYVSDEEAGALLARPLSSSWGQNATLPAELEKALDQEHQRLAHACDELEEAARDRNIRLPLVHLREAFGLSQFELDTLLLAIAPSVDLRYERLFGYLQDDVTKKRPTVNLALDLLAEPGIGRLPLLAAFEPTAPLFHFQLLELQPPGDTNHTRASAPLLAHVLHADEGLLAWLLGRYRPHSALVGSLSIHQVPTEIPSAFVSPSLAQSLAGSEEGLFLFYGPDGDGQRAAAAIIARERGRLLMIVDLKRLIVDKHLEPEHAVSLALREARLTNALPMLMGWDAVLAEETTPPELLYALISYPGTVIVAGHAHWIPRGTPRKRAFTEVAFPIPEYEQRLELWAHFTGSGAADAEDAQLHDALAALAGQFALTSGQIRDAVATARDRALADGREETGATADDLFAAARAHSNPRLAKLANKITPRYGWEDIILPDDQLALLHEIIDTVRGRPQVLDVWGLDRKLTSSRGVTVLFSGPPGTGKTMGAQIIAGELGLDLYRIDLSTVVSKYIGETEKNIERIFSEAEQSNAILFFDEADALFGKRSEVRDSHDRYANIEVSYLLQRMEAYDGVTILATNLRGNLDEAFTRRLQFAVSFPFPEAEDRLRIWRTLFPAEVPRESDIDFEVLAERFRLAGGNIRNILVSAAYLAAADGGTLTMPHLLHSTRRELQKMGRLVNEQDLTVDTGSEGS